ncbi:SNARE associated Golgi family protein [Melia azedarach]|uniref:SNARE associated Golgi family protein n=1 Tax=Melia azedarach TaxID=155640 RepID=A0ACC1XNU4_MELAZ|nr:SNARE associated Golgi family protein [Melia azedarach]
MTYYEEDNEVVPDLGLRIDVEENNNIKGDYVKLRECEEEEPGSPRRWSCGKVWYWLKLALLLTCLGLLAGVFIKWVGPFFMDKEVIPIINWETTTFSTPVLALLVFASVALFPTLLLPSSPSMWVAGMTFGYGFGFLLIMSAVAVGISLPYFIGSLFLHRIQGWLEKYPKKAAILRAAGEGDWFHQFRTVALIRISPFPYIIYNYCAVATHVKFGPYFLGSLAGMVPEIFVTIYTGIMIRTLADASHESHFLSAPQIIFNVIGFTASVATTIFFTVYAKRQLKVLQQREEELLLQ